MQAEIFPIATTFGITAPAAAAISGFAYGHQWQASVPKIKPKYRFRRHFLLGFINWLIDPQGDGFYVTGPTGGGKSSGPAQVAARLNWPLLAVGAHSRLEMPELTGFHSMGSDDRGNPRMRFILGALARAMKLGFIFNLDEGDLLDPGVFAGLHSVLDGGPLVLTENGGEVIEPHPNFRFLITGNSRGQGDDTGMHGGVQKQNVAAMDRFLHFYLGYMEASEESEMLQSNVGVTAELADSMVKVANMIRQLYIGDPDYVVGGAGGPAMSVTMSTRTLLRWARRAAGFTAAGAEHPLKYALELSLTNRTKKVEAVAIHQICKSVFGSTWDGTN